MRSLPFFIAALISALTGCSTFPTERRHEEGASQISRHHFFSNRGLVLREGDRLNTPGSFKPPVDISIVAKTDSTNLRIGYAADQVIFNWERNPEELRVDGGPANGLHRPGLGKIPPNKYVHIHWVVTPLHQAIYVDKELRFEHAGDYSEINNRVCIFPGAGSHVTVKSIKVRELQPATTDGKP